MCRVNGEHDGLRYIFRNDLQSRKDTLMQGSGFVNVINYISSVTSCGFSPTYCTFYSFYCIGASHDTSVLLLFVEKS